MTQEILPPRKVEIRANDTVVTITVTCSTPDEATKLWRDLNTQGYHGKIRLEVDTKQA